MGNIAILSPILKLLGVLAKECLSNDGNVAYEPVLSKTMVGNEHIFMNKQTVSLQIWLAWIL